ncbi:MAG TPA: amino acid adenylation domain-containing protein, partial [Thermoanaerobaculia bacterium]
MNSDIDLIYELSPMQQAMLFHSLYAPGSGVYVLQQSLRLTGRLDLAAFERAWRHIIDRHDILRTAFFWEGLEKPVQVVYRQAALEVTRESWRGLDPAEQQTRLARFLDADRERGFDAAAAPLMRVSLFELAADAYQVVWTQHHLVVDGWSQGQVLRELFAAYTAFAAGGEPRLPPVRGYREYISWLQRQDGEQAEAFWRKALAGFDSPTWIAGGDGKAEGPAWRESGERELVLPAAATGALREAARRHALTLNTLMQGAWALFLARETGAAEVVFGTTVAGRPPGLPGVESIVGPFINTLPLRVAVRPERRLWEWLADLQARQVEMRRFEHSSLVEVQRWSALPAGVRLFDHIVVFENQALAGGADPAQVPGLAITAEGGSSLTNYPLNLIVLPGSALTLLIRYDTSRFTAAAVARMLARLERLLTAFAADEDLALEDVPQLGAAERHQIVVEWGSPAGGEGRQTLHARFERQARRTPNAVAVTFEGLSLTYAELNRRANQLAWHLRALGVGPEDRVGLRGERSPELLEGILGILKAGAAYVPLDPRYPSERLAYMAEDAGVRVVVGTEPVALDRLRSHLESLPAHDPPAFVDAASLAYVIYTSGSTGRPKGVQVTHGNVVRLFDATADWFGFTASDVWTLFHSYAFDFSVWEIWGALLHGGRVVVVPWAVSRAPEQFLALLAAEKVTVLNQTPSAFAQLARIAADRVPASLRLVIFGGEALDIGSLAPWFARHGDAWPRLVNMYGITETTVHVTYRPLAREDTGQDTGRRSVIGRRIPDLGLYLLDPSGQPVPIGVAGEIAVGGAGLARGYLGRPELTAERFVPDGLSGRRGARLYRSGDLGRFLPDGTAGDIGDIGDIEYLGRIDHQVKIRGFRIELGEIEAVLAGHPAVRECVVLARQDGGMAEDARLVAYLVAASPAALPAPEELRAHLRATLPDHMVPAAFVWLPALPLTQNGKVDRKALPAPEGLRAAESGYVAPADAVEERLAAIWSEVLRVERVGAHNDFFALGGHSLLATQVASRLREAFGLEIPLRGLFEAPTVAGLAEVIDEQAEQAAAALDLTALLDDLDHLSDDEAAARLDDPQAVRSMARARSLEAATATALVEEELPLAPVALPRQAGDNRFPLSFAQQRLWFLDQLEPDSPAYNVPLPVRLRGELPTARLARIAAELVGRHETLRTTFLESDGEPVQVVHAAPEPAPALGLIDLSGLPDAVREAAARRIVELDAWQPFDLRRGPLLRLRLLRLAPRDHLLLLTLHHIVSDGWSMRVLLREVAALFAAARLPELEFQYADFAVWQRTWLQGRVLEEQLAFWKRQLAGAPSVLELPTDRPRPAVQTFRGASVQRALPPAVAAAVRELCRREDVTPFMALLAAWALLLGRHAGQKEVVIGSPVAGR